MRLKELRIEKRLSQEYVARLLNVSRVTIDNWENGSTEPTYSKAVELAKLYGVPLDKL